MTAGETQEHHVNLDPLRSHGPDALDTHDVPSLKKATLTEIKARFQNESLGTLTLTAKNLFALEKNTPSRLIPADATLTQAGIELEIDGEPRPHKVILRPPATVILEFPGDATRIFAWLDKRHFRTLAAILLAIASAVAPALDDDDGDEDDCPSDRITLAQT